MHKHLDKQSNPSLSRKRILGCNPTDVQEVTCQNAHIYPKYMPLDSSKDEPHRHKNKRPSSKSRLSSISGWMPPRWWAGTQVWEMLRRQVRIQWPLFFFNTSGCLVATVFPQRIGVFGQKCFWHQDVVEKLNLGDCGCISSWKSCEATMKKRPLRSHAPMEKRSHSVI